MSLTENPLPMTGPTDSDVRATPLTFETWRMFDRIAFRYDLLNRLLSMRQDVLWRREMVRNLPPGNDLVVLDLATGTADVLLEFAASPRVSGGIGLDMSANMLAFARKKVSLKENLGLVRGDAASIGAADGSVDAVSIAFGIRNVPDVREALREMRRVLKPGGRALILEFGLPSNRLFRALYLFYFRNVLPRVGSLVSGDAEAYRYLNRSVEGFPYGEAFCALMRDAGLEKVRATTLSFGIAMLYVGERSDG